MPLTQNQKIAAASVGAAACVGVVAWYLYTRNGTAPKTKKENKSVSVSEKVSAPAPAPAAAAKPTAAEKTPTPKASSTSAPKSTAAFLKFDVAGMLHGVALGEILGNAFGERTSSTERVSVMLEQRVIAALAGWRVPSHLPPYTVSLLEAGRAMELVRSRGLEVLQSDEFRRRLPAPSSDGKKHNEAAGGAAVRALLAGWVTLGDDATTETALNRAAFACADLTGISARARAGALVAARLLRFFARPEFRAGGGSRAGLVEYCSRGVNFVDGSTFTWLAHLNALPDYHDNPEPAWKLLCTPLPGHGDSVGLPPCPGRAAVTAVYILLHSKSVSNSVLAALSFGGRTGPVAALVAGVSAVRDGLEDLPEWMGPLVQLTDKQLFKDFERNALGTAK